MVSIFRKKMEEKADETLNVNPPSVTAVAVKTTTALSQELDNPIYCAINNMSASDGVKLLQTSSVINGVSFVSKLPAVGKAEKVYINPKIPGGALGSSYGKIGNLIPGDLDKTLVTSDLLFIGGNNQTPSVLNHLDVRVVKHQAVLEPQQQHEQAQSVATNKSFANQQMNMNLNPGQIISKDISAMTGKEKPPTNTATGVNRTNIRTGTYKIDAATITQLSKGQFDDWLGGH